MRATAVAGDFVEPEYLRLEAIRSGYSQRSFQEIANLMGAYLGIPLPVQVRIVDAPLRGETAGSYKVLGDFHRVVEIVRNPWLGIDHILAILAHESTHHYLHEYKIRKTHEKENEILTDLAAAYIGFGPVLFRGYQTIRHADFLNSTQSSLTLGYVSPRDIRTASRFATALRFERHGHNETTIKNANSLQRKKCPFCKEVLQISSDRCQHCNRVIFERTSR